MLTRFRVCVWAPIDASSGKLAAFWSQATLGARAEPGATWNGEASVVPMVVEVPFFAGSTTTPCQIRLEYDWYDSAGYLYVDPTFELVSA